MDLMVRAFMALAGIERFSEQAIQLQEILANLLSLRNKRRG